MAVTNLTYLRTITDGNKAIIREMIEMFLIQVPVFIQNMHKFYEDKNYVALGKEAHKAKSSLQIMGMTELEAEMKTLLLKTIAGTEVESYPTYINNFVSQCDTAVVELNAVMKTL